MLQASLMELGANVIDYGIIGDTAEAMTNILPKASAECDILITTGSASMGDAGISFDKNQIPLLFLELTFMKHCLSSSLKIPTPS